MSSSLVITEKEPGCTPFLSANPPATSHQSRVPHPTLQRGPQFGQDFPPSYCLASSLFLQYRNVEAKVWPSLGSVAVSIAVKLSWVCLTTSGHQDIRRVFLANTQTGLLQPWLLLDFFCSPGASADPSQSPSATVTMGLHKSYLSHHTRWSVPTDLGPERPQCPPWLLCPSLLWVMSSPTTALCYLHLT